MFMIKRDYLSASPQAFTQNIAVQITASKSGGSKSVVQTMPCEPQMHFTFLHCSGTVAENFKASYLRKLKR